MILVGTAGCHILLVEEELVTPSLVGREIWANLGINCKSDGDGGDDGDGDGVMCFISTCTD